MTVKKLRPWFVDKELIFSRFQKNRYIFIDNGGSVLFVAHLDTIQKPYLKKQTRKCIYGSGFDDRLGCYTAYQLGWTLRADILLCDDEERGQSTAQFFPCEKDYNWIAEFDREGIDYVDYGLSNESMRQALNKYWQQGFGSFSDISNLQTNCCCFNLGIGFYKSHSIDSFVNIRQYDMQIAKFVEFYNKYHYTNFGQRQLQCDFCMSKDTINIYGINICSNCFYDILMEDEVIEEDVKLNNLNLPMCDNCESADLE